MADSVVLLRRKVQDLSLAMQDGTMNSNITLATIEVGSSPARIRNLCLPPFLCPKANHELIPVWQGQYRNSRNARHGRKKTR